MNNRFFLYAFCLLVFMPVASVASEVQQGPDLQSARSIGLTDLLAQLQKGTAVDLLKAGIGDTKADDIPYAALAQIMFMRRHIAEAAYLYSIDIDLDPDHIESHANLAASLVELDASSDLGMTRGLLDWALASAWHAAGQTADSALILNTVSRAALALYDKAGEDAYLSEALAAAKRAVELDQSEPLLWSNLARVHKKSGNDAAANKALARAKASGPNNPGYWVAAISFGQNPEPVVDQTAPSDTQPHQCKVSYNCQAQCLAGLSTGPLIVSCELEQASQQMNCEAGKRYASGYDCKAEKLLFGQSNPKPEIKFCAPNICITMQLEKSGGATVKTEVKRALGPVDGFIALEGKYSPSNGFSFVKLSPDIRFNLLSKAPAAGTLEKWGVGTSFTSGKDGKPGKFEVGAQSYSTALLGI